MRFSHTRAALVAALALLAAGTAAAHADHGAAAKPGNAAAAQPAARAVAKMPDARGYFTDLPLKTQDGKDVRFYSDVLEGRTVLINVIYTNCKDACPMITARLNEVRSILGEQVFSKLHFVSISSDPERDTPKALKRFAAENKAEAPNWTFLTGTKTNIDHILKKLGQFDEEVTAHSTLLIAGNVPAKRWTKIRPEAPPAVVAERLRVLIDGSRDSLFGTPVNGKGGDKPH